MLCAVIQNSCIMEETLGCDTVWMLNCSSYSSMMSKGCVRNTLSAVCIPTGSSHCHLNVHACYLEIVTVDT